VNFHTNLEGT